jgi:hypothetical protein
LKSFDLPATPSNGGFEHISFGRDLDRKTPEQYLLDDVKRQDPTVSVVSMNENKTIQVAGDQKHTLFTFGLGGCTAALILSQKPDGSSVATMTHYDPLHRQIHPLVIQRDVLQHHRDLPEGTKHSVMIVAPASWVKVGEKWENQVEDVPLTSSLVDATKKGISQGDIEVKLCPYSECMQIGKSSGFIVRFNPKGSDPVRYEAHGEHFGSLPLEPQKVS